MYNLECFVFFFSARQLAHPRDSFFPAQRQQSRDMKSSPVSEKPTNVEAGTKTQQISGQYQRMVSLDGDPHRSQEGDRRLGVPT